MTAQESQSNLSSTIGELLDRSAERHGTREFLVEGSDRLTFQQCRDRVRAAARAFVASGLGHGDRVAIWAPNSTDWVVACLGLQYVGCTLVPVNTRYRGTEAAFILTKSKARCLITTTDFVATNYVAMLRDTGASLPDLRDIVILSGLVPSGTTSWPDFVGRGEACDDDELQRRAGEVTSQDLCDIMFTSGTTGSPKGVMLAHGQTVRIIEVWNRLLALAPGDRYLVLNPFFHLFGYKYGWLCSLMAGVTVYPVAVFDPAGMLDLIERERITVVPGQPTVFKGLMDVPDLAERDIASLRLSVIGSTSIPPQLVRDMYAVLGFTQVVSGYGLTETNGEITLCRFGDDVETVATTVGRPLEGVQVRIVDRDDADVAPGTPGEVVVKGYNVMRGYLDEPEQTAAAFDAAGWLHTGDIGYLDPNGSLRLTGRLKDIYIVGGLNVSPAEVEALLLDHPAVRDVAVVGVPDSRLGEVGAAFVVARSDSITDDIAGNVTDEDLISWCRGRLANFKVPRHVWFVDRLPYNAIGKVTKDELRRQASEMTSG